MQMLVFLAAAISGVFAEEPVGRRPYGMEWAGM